MNGRSTERHRRPESLPDSEFGDYLSAMAGTIRDSGEFPMSFAEDGSAALDRVRAFGYRLITPSTRPDLLKDRQLLLWPEAVPAPERPPLVIPRHEARGSASVESGDSLFLSEKWTAPTVIVSDGPYGLSSFPGDPATPDDLAGWYEPHLRAWHTRALPSCTLWFWNSEQGWANCHRMIEECGWEFRNCHVWDKGMAHVAGNVNTRTIRKYPVVTEVCVQYVRKNTLPSGGRVLPLREWLRAEWKRTGLPFSQTNDACGVKDAATRKYFSKDHLWYFPPEEAFTGIAAFANAHGRPEGKPYFAKADGSPFASGEWSLMRAKFHCEIGVNNVWHEPAVRGEERLKNGASALHMNQKPLALLELAIRSSSDPGDVVWEPFGGLCSASVAAIRTGRHAFAAEIHEPFFKIASRRLQDEQAGSSAAVRRAV